MVGKKGMSPLIATILLMAFAVALGAVIMNWSTKIPEGGTDCKQTVELEIRQFCMVEGELNVEIRNVAETEIAEIALSVSDPPIEIPHMVIKNSQLGNGQSLDTVIPFGFSQRASVGIVPSIDDHGKAVACGEPIKIYEGVPDC